MAISAQGLAFVKYESNGSDRDFQFHFPYISTKDIKVFIDGVSSSDYIITSGSIITFSTEPNIGVIVFIRRETPNIEPLATFGNQSSLNKEDLEKNNEQVLYVMQEVLDEVNQRLPVGGSDNQILNNLNMNNFRILDLGTAIDDGDAINLGQVTELIQGVNAGISVEEEEIVAEQGQTIFNLSKFTYQPGYKTITIHIDGISQAQTDFLETSSETVEIDEPCKGGERVVIRKNDAPSNTITIKQSDYEILGGVILARDNEALEGTDRLKAITPASLAYVLQRFLPQDATTTTKGVTRLASSGETGDNIASTPDSTQSQIDTSINAKLIVGGGPPNNADGNPDGTIWFQTTQLQ